MPTPPLPVPGVGAAKVSQARLNQLAKDAQINYADFGRQVVNELLGHIEWLEQFTSTSQNAISQLELNGLITRVEGDGLRARL